MSGVIEVLVESWVVGAAVKKVGIHKQIGLLYTRIHLKPFISGICSSLGKVTVVSKSVNSDSLSTYSFHHYLPTKSPAPEHIQLLKC